MNVKAIYAVARELDGFPFRSADAAEIVRQIGRVNLGAISGGRVVALDYGIILPVAHGYYVAVTLAPDDTYVVRRVFVRAGRAFVKRTWADVYCEEVGEVAYRASCYLDADTVGAVTA